MPQLFESGYPFLIFSQLFNSEPADAHHDDDRDERQEPQTKLKTSATSGSMTAFPLVLTFSEAARSRERASDFRSSRSFRCRPGGGRCP